ncbi:T-kininogen 2 [Tetranychus urticae]|uniref:Cystatin domain-containing protein n=1 Tax=Tetranychus urticae TaxID=32264 RepID=T1JYB5_TETUR|nr:T-kininogen 2 [Tetranychus urticae]
MKFLILSVCLFGALFATSPPIEWTPLPVDDPTVITLADQAVAYINAQDNSLYYNKLIQIKEAKSRVADKVEYELKLVIRITDCPKSKPYTDACQINQDEPPKLCTIDAYVRAGSEENKIYKFLCGEI